MLLKQVYDYLHVHNQNKEYFNAKDLLDVLQAQAFKYKQIDIKDCIQRTFDIKTNEDWYKIIINFKYFYNCIINYKEVDRPECDEAYQQPIPEESEAKLNSSPSE